MKNLLAIATCKTLMILEIAILTSVPALAQQGRWTVDAEPGKSALHINTRLMEDHAVAFDSMRFGLGPEGALPIASAMPLARRGATFSSGEGHVSPIPNDPVTRTVTRSVTVVRPVVDNAARGTQVTAGVIRGGFRAGCAWLNPFHRRPTIGEVGR
jgi:hypothetical protein